MMRVRVLELLPGDWVAHLKTVDYDVKYAQELVGGPVEYLPLIPGVLELAVNMLGHLPTEEREPLARNEIACALFRGIYEVDFDADWVVGPVIAVGAFKAGDPVDVGAGVLELLARTGVTIQQED